MTDEKRGGPPSRGGPGGGNREGRPGGGGRRDDKRGGPRKGGFGKGGPAKPERRETYESLQLLTRGEGFKIDKFVLAEKGTHKPVKVEYRLTREGLNGVHNFPRLIDAQTAATAELPEPEIVEEAVETAAEADAETVEGEAENTDVEHAGEEAPAELEAVEAVITEGEDSAEHVASGEHVATDEAAS
jgi:hypothetical protein